MVFVFDLISATLFSLPGRRQNISVFSFSLCSLGLETSSIFLSDGILFVSRNDSQHSRKYLHFLIVHAAVRHSVDLLRRSNPDGPIA